MVEITPDNLQALRAALQNTPVEAQLLQGGEEGLNERTLSRWLRARKGDVTKAAKDLTEHAAWRAKHVPEGRIQREAVSKHVAMRSAFLPGYDKTGHPALIARVRSHLACKDHQDFVNWMIYTLDGGILCGMQEEARTGRAWDGKLVGLLDLQGMGLANCDSSGLMTIFNLLQAVMAVSGWLQHHYVERLHKMYLYCAPTVFYTIWTVVSPFIDPVTRTKVQFVSAKEAAVMFAEEFEPGVLPPELMGTGPERFLPDELSKLYAELDSNKPAGEHEHVMADTPAAASETILTQLPGT